MNFYLVVKFTVILFFWLLPSPCFSAEPIVALGIERVFSEEPWMSLLKEKKIGLITNQSAINQSYKTTAECFLHQTELKVILAPEHGFYGDAYAYGEAKESDFFDKVPIYNLHGLNRRPSEKMLEDIELLVYDVQDIGSRSYSYLSTLFYCMEEAAKKGIPLMVLDRPNPLGGNVVDGFIIDKKWRSFLGYVETPYCHGMTAGELAQMFNEEHKVGCELMIVPMKGWKRSMIFKDTGLPWVPASPQIPESDTPFFYPITGILGHLSIVSIGVGYTLPFKIIGAPWIEAENFASHLNQLKLPGVHFHPVYFRPFFGKFKGEVCQGVKIMLSDPHIYRPITTCYALLGIIKTLYPEQFTKSIHEMLAHPSKEKMFHKLNGKEEVLKIILEEKYFIWTLRALCDKDRATFIKFREKYLISTY